MMTSAGRRASLALGCLFVLMSHSSAAHDEVAVAGPTGSTSTSPPPDCLVPDQLRGVEIERLPVKAKVVALTFDAGANAEGVASILTTLSAKHVRATFFLTGDFANSFPKKSARIGSRYLLGNHTMSHPDLTTLPDRRVRRQVRHAQATLTDVTGQDPRRFFRFPYGASDERTIKIVNNLCYVPFRWTVDTLGWEGTQGGMTVHKVVARVLDGAQPGEVVLMHVGSNPDDGTTLDAHALPTIIKKLRALGYRLVPLSRVLDPAP
jgi:peptidoglycan/xylan/chitin deacetylase (PgdA/CDA1 family)